MNKILGALIAAILVLSPFGATVAMAAEPAGMSFCPGGMPGGKNELLRKMNQSLAADPRGYRVLEGCHAAPIHFLLAWQKGDPGARLTSVDQLPAYVDKLVVMATPKDVEYQSSCLQVRGGALTVIMGCVTRTIRKGEVVYGNPDTGIRTLMGSCANPGVAESLELVVTAAPCLRIDFPTQGKGQAVRFAYIGANPLPGRCHSYQLAGVRERLYSTPEECPDVYKKMIGNREVTVVCSWDQVEAAVSEELGFFAEVQNVSGSFYARAAGTNSWYLPPEALNGGAVICWEMPDGSFRTVGVSYEHYNASGVATITNRDVEAAIY